MVSFIRILLFYFIGLAAQQLAATHIRGGYFQVSSRKAGNQYTFTVRMHMYSEYISNPSLSIPPDEWLEVAIYRGSGIVREEALEGISHTLHYGCFNDTFYHSIYEGIFTLDSVNTLYQVQYSRCCREEMEQIVDGNGIPNQPLGFYAWLPCIDGFASPEPDFSAIISTLQNKSLKQKLDFKPGTGYDSTTTTIRKPYGGPATSDEPIVYQYPNSIQGTLVSQKAGFKDTTPLGPNSHLYIQNGVLILDFIDSGKGIGSLEQRVFKTKKEIFRSNIELVFYVEEQRVTQPNAREALTRCTTGNARFTFNAPLCPQAYPPPTIYLYHALDTSGTHKPVDSCKYSPYFVYSGAILTTNFFRLSYHYPGMSIVHTPWFGIDCAVIGTAAVSKGECWKVFPNPANTLLQFQGRNIPNSITLISTSGQQINFPVSEGVVNISSMPKGVYFLRNGLDILKIVLY